MPLHIPSIFGISLEVYIILIILGIPVFFLWRWVFRRYIRAERTRKIATWTATIFTTPLLYAGIFLLIFYSLTYYPTHEFDQMKWSSNMEKRYEMSKNLIESQILIGENKSEVKQLLGDNLNNEQSDQWTYYLGMVPGIANIDPDVLEIEFKNGKAVKVWQRGT